MVNDILHFNKHVCIKNAGYQGNTLSNLRIIFSCIPVYHNSQIPKSPNQQFNKQRVFIPLLQL
jgi:hypothetical protein